MRRGYTLIEIILTIAITGILAIGMFKALEAITIRSEKAKILTTLSIDSQSALDQLSLLLYDRAPMSAQGCSTPNDCVALDIAINAKILQWYGTASESYQAGDYSGFVDMNASVASKPILQSPNTDLSKVLTTQQNKWSNSFTLANMGLIFAGTFEDGVSQTPNLFKSTNDKIELNNTVNIPKIYEKYYLVDSAYAVTRKHDAPSCPSIDLTQYQDNDLLLYYNYRPWKTPAQTMCDGNVTVLSANVNAFAAHQINGTIRLGIDMNKSAGNMKTNPVRLSKQKVVF